MLAQTGMLANQADMRQCSAVAPRDPLSVQPGVGVHQGVALPPQPAMQQQDSALCLGSRSYIFLVEDSYLYGAPTPLASMLT